MAIGPSEGMNKGIPQGSIKHTLTKCWVSQHVIRRFENDDSEENMGEAEDDGPQDDVCQYHWSSFQWADEKFFQID